MQGLGRWSGLGACRWGVYMCTDDSRVWWVGAGVDVDVWVVPVSGCPVH